MQNVKLQQGDVLIVDANIALVKKEVDNSPNRISKHSGIIREGETTGHAHRIVGTDFEVLDIGGRILANIISGDCRIVHEEHGTIDLLPGEYEFLPVHEYDHFAEEARYVRD